jgi:endonuclease/exonuclease/phosphatase (EEP) superfamily protein YafD
VYLLNPNYADIAAFIAKHDPDIVAIMECNLHLANQLANVRTHYVTQMWNPGWNSQSNIVLTKFPDAELARHSILGMEMTQVTFQPLQSDRQHQLYFLHTLSPGWPGNRVHIRNQQLETMAGEIGKNETDPIIVMGDFNTSPWSRIFRKVLAQARLIDTRAYRGYFSSWPSFFYDLGIPIDHALVNDKVNVIRREVLYDGIGSDHRPVLLEIE